MMKTRGSGNHSPNDRPPNDRPPDEAAVDRREATTPGDGLAAPADAAGTDSTAPAQDAPAPGDDRSAQLAEAQAKITENWDLFLRARADLENYRRRMERDIGATIRRGKRDLLTRLLDVLDALDRAAAWEAGLGASGATDAAGTAGAVLIRRLLLKVLTDEGVAPIECLGQPFDPAAHEAVDVRTDAAAQGPTITGELQKGYTYEDEVIRPARVQVTQSPG